MRHGDRSQTDQGDVLDDSYHVTSSLIASAPKIMLLYFIFNFLIKHKDNKFILQNQKYFYNIINIKILRIFHY